MFLTYCAVFVCLFAVIAARNLIRVDDNSAWSINDSGCITPINQAGDCMYIEECPPIADYLTRLDQKGGTMSKHEKQVFGKYICELGSRMKVCCPRGHYKEPELHVMMRSVLPEDDCGNYVDPNRISGGNETELFEFPWMVILVYENGNMCAGSLINEQYVLTAAHCVAGNIQESLLHVRLGEYNRKSELDCVTHPEGNDVCADPVQDITVDQVIVHQGFNQAAYQNDIALLKLSRKAKLSASVQPICLPTSKAAKKAVINKMVITGWGKYSQLTDKTSDILQKVELPVVDLQTCQMIYSRYPINDKHLCVGDGSTKNSCNGDSGGAVQMVATIGDSVKYVQYGIVSLGGLGNSCNFSTSPGIHTKVEPFIPWIIENIRL